MKNTHLKAKLHYIKNESVNTPIVNYSGENETQNYSDDYVFHITEIENARLSKATEPASLDKEAFKLACFTPKDVNYLDAELVKQKYYLEVEALVKKETGATDVFVFDHTVRRGIKNSNRHPAYHIHNDYTFKTGTSRAESILGEKVLEQFAGKRMVQINVWRSIDGVVEKDPLALMDATTLDKNDLVETQIKFNDANTGETHNGEIFALKKNKAQKWYYYPDINAEEAILIKGFDTDKSNACFAMHTAFALPNQGNHNKPRQSIETRTYAFFDV
ncbi:MAG: CmcJ/NvfI family oxidoreductase [Nonlabens ulvanivorans]|uniref:CmcJ/NvfI family oxidoreductase n=1 Tax=Nonlabens ulvanivorans TaxID=906888 RepID=UPI0032643482